MNDLYKKSGGAFWLNDFNLENVIDYAVAAREMSQFLRVLFEEGFDSVVVPSRGSWPLLTAAKSAWYIEQRAMRGTAGAHKEKLKILMSPLHQITILPFSADPQAHTQTTAAIRRYWTRVLAAIVRRNGKDPHLVTYKAVIECLAKRSWLNVLPRDLPSEKFIFIDTVMSGRAICEIVSAFKEVGLDQCYFLLIVDEEGRNIKGEYARVIEDLESAGRCTRISVKRLFTEDRGPAVSGIWSTVYPQFLHEIQKTYPWANNAYGAGSFYHQVSSSQVEPKEGLGDAKYNMPVTRLFASLSLALHLALTELQRIDSFPNDVLASTGVKIDHDKYKLFTQETKARMERQLEFQLNDARECVAEFGNLTPLDQETTRLLAAPRVQQIEPTAEVTVSSSHIVRVTLPDDVVQDRMRQINSALQSGENVFTDSWFRNA
jgi:hypothetical protein